MACHRGLSRMNGIDRYPSMSLWVNASQASSIMNTLSVVTTVDPFQAPLSFSILYVYPVFITFPFMINAVGLLLPPSVLVWYIVQYVRQPYTFFSCFLLPNSLIIFIDMSASEIKHVSSPPTIKCSIISPKEFPVLLQTPMFLVRKMSNAFSIVFLHWNCWATLHWLRCYDVSCDLTALVLSLPMRDLLKVRWE